MNLLKDFLALVINKLDLKIDNETSRATIAESNINNNITILSDNIESEYQKKLIAGDNIEIDPITNEISAISGGGGAHNYRIQIERLLPYNGSDIGDIQNIIFDITSTEDISGDSEIILSPTLRQVAELFNRFGLIVKADRPPDVTNWNFTGYLPGILRQFPQTDPLAPVPFPLLFYIDMNASYINNTGQLDQGLWYVQYYFYNGSSWTSRSISLNIDDRVANGIIVQKMS